MLRPLPACATSIPTVTWNPCTQALLPMIFCCKVMRSSVSRMKFCSKNFDNNVSLILFFLAPKAGSNQSVKPADESGFETCLNLL